MTTPVSVIMRQSRSAPHPRICAQKSGRCARATLISPTLRAGIQYAPALRIGGSPMTARIRPYALPGLRRAFPHDEAGTLLGAAGAAGVHADRDGPQRAAAQSARRL